MKKLSISALVALSILGSCANASASDIGVNFQLTGTSNYVLRGMTQTDDKAAVFGDFTLSYSNFFAGIWASNVSFEDIGVDDADVEIDYYAGYSNEINNFGLTAVYAKYTYPGSDLIDDLDELKFDTYYKYNDLKVGARYEMGIWNESDSKKLDYVEGYTSYSFDIADVSLSAGSYEDTGDNYKLILSKADKFAGIDTQFSLNFVNFNAENSDVPFKDDNKLYAKIIFNF